MTLFLHVLALVFVVFFSFAAPPLAHGIAVVWICVSNVTPAHDPLDGRDWIAASAPALAVLALGVTWLLGQQQLAEVLFCAFALTVYFQTTLRL